MCSLVRIVSKNFEQGHYCSILKFIRMKKLTIVLIIVLFNIAFFACTPERIIDPMTPQSCCGEGGEIPPPIPTDTIGG